MATFIAETDKLIAWHYVISELTIIYTAGTYNIPLERVTEINISGNLETDLFPKFSIKMILEPVIYKEILDNKYDVKLKIRMQKIPEDRSTGERGLARDCILKTFSILLVTEFTDPDNSIRTETKLNGTDPNTEQTNSLRTDQIGSSQYYYLYNDSVLYGSKNTVNAVLKSVNMIGAISYLANSMKIDNMLISPIENNMTYNEIILPPQSALSQILYLDYEYGFYKNGSVIFFDYDYSYILNYKGNCTAYIQDEIKETCVLIPERGGEYSAHEGTIEKPEENNVRNYVIVKATGVNITSPSNASDIIQGNKTTIINTNSNQIISSSSNTSQKGNGSSEIINSNSHNQWLGETFAAQKAANSCVVSFNLIAFDINAIRPNKRYTLAFENTQQGEKYRGVYMLSRYEFKFIKSGSEFNLDGSFEIKRVASEVSVDNQALMN